MRIKALIPLANGSEDIESITLIDVFRRADWAVTVCSVQTQNNLSLARKTRVATDCHITDISANEFDLIALPGGLPGAENLAKSSELGQMLLNQRQQDRFIAAICAAPALVLQPLGLLDNCQATCYPSFSEHLENWIDQPVVTDNRCVTSQGPGTALPFALELVALLDDRAKADTIRKQMLVS